MEVQADLLEIRAAAEVVLVPPRLALLARVVRVEAVAVKFDRRLIR